MTKAGKKERKKEKKAREIRAEEVAGRKSGAMATKEQLPEENKADEIVEITVKEHEKLKKENEEYFDRMARIAAEYENYKKRINKERELWNIAIKKDALKDILSIADSVIRGLESDDNSKSGLAAVRDQIDAILENSGVYRIETEGRILDPDVHKAVFLEEREDLPDKTILEEIETGYTVQGVVLRPAKVKVSKYPEKKKEEIVESENIQEKGKNNADV